MKRSLFIVALLGSVNITTLQAREYYGNGYTIITETPIKNADLKQIINKRIAAQTIQEGLQLLLKNTGWRLSGIAANNPKILSLYNAPWPEHWTFLGPDQLDNILITIGGEGWQLVVDPVNRLIGYEIKPQFQKRGQR